MAHEIIDFFDVPLVQCCKSTFSSTSLSVYDAQFLYKKQTIDSYATMEYRRGTGCSTHELKEENDLLVSNEVATIMLERDGISITWNSYVRNPRDDTLFHQTGSRYSCKPYSLRRNL